MKKETQKTIKEKQTTIIVFFCKRQTRKWRTGRVRELSQCRYELQWQWGRWWWGQNRLWHVQIWKRHLSAYSQTPQPFRSLLVSETKALDSTTQIASLQWLQVPNPPLCKTPFFSFFLSWKRKKKKKKSLKFWCFFEDSETESKKNLGWVRKFWERDVCLGWDWERRQTHRSGCFSWQMGCRLAMRVIYFLDGCDLLGDRWV